MPHKQVGKNYFSRAFSISTSTQKIVHTEISSNEIYSVAFR